MTSLNPAMTVGDQIAESVILHQHLGKKAALEKAEEMLHLVGIPAPAQRLREYPHHDERGHAPAGDDRHCPGL